MPPLGQTKGEVNTLICQVTDYQHPKTPPDDPGSGELDSDSGRYGLEHKSIQFFHGMKYFFSPGGQTDDPTTGHGFLREGPFQHCAYRAYEL